MPPTSLDRCMSPHVAMPQQDRTHLEWHPPEHRFNQTRTIAWTCSCRATVYELCAGGGQAFIRRTVQLDEGNRVHETSPSSIKNAWTLWASLLAGAAR